MMNNKLKIKYISFAAIVILFICSITIGTSIVSKYKLIVDIKNQNKNIEVSIDEKESQNKSNSTEINKLEQNNESIKLDIDKIKEHNKSLNNELVKIRTGQMDLKGTMWKGKCDIKSLRIGSGYNRDFSGDVELKINENNADFKMNIDTTGKSYLTQYAKDRKAKTLVFHSDMNISKTNINDGYIEFDDKVTNNPTNSEGYRDNEDYRVHAYVIGNKILGTLTHKTLFDSRYVVGTFELEKNL